MAGRNVGPKLAVGHPRKNTRRREDLSAGSRWLPWIIGRAPVALRCRRSFLRATLRSPDRDGPLSPSPCCRRSCNTDTNETEQSFSGIISWPNARLYRPPHPTAAKKLCLVARRTGGWTCTTRDIFRVWNVNVYSTWKKECKKSDRKIWYFFIWFWQKIKKSSTENDEEFFIFFE